MIGDLHVYNTMSHSEKVTYRTRLNNDIFIIQLKRVKVEYHIRGQIFYYLHLSGHEWPGNPTHSVIV